MVNLSGKNPLFVLSIVLVFACLLVFTACKSNQKFEPVKWKEKVDGIYPYRGEMVDDLTENHRLKGLPYTDLKELLGLPDGIDTTRVTEIYYVLSAGEGRNAEKGKGANLTFVMDDSLRVKTFNVRHHAE